MPPTSEASIHPLDAPAPTKILSDGVLGMLIFVLTEIMLFAGLISAFTIIRASAPIWPPPGQPRLPIEATLLNTAALLASAGFLYAARRAFNRGDRSGTQRSLLVALLLGAFFVVFQGFEWVALIGQGLTLTSSSLGSFFYLIVGLHAIHALVAIFLLGRAWRQLQRGWITSSSLGAAEVFWYFVVLVWPAVYLRVYL